MICINISEYIVFETVRRFSVFVRGATTNDILPYLYRVFARGFQTICRIIRERINKFDAAGISLWNA